MDTKTKAFYSWEARLYEYYQLRWRYRWLIWRNPTFMQDLQAADAQALRQGVISSYDRIFKREITAENLRTSFKDMWRKYRSLDEAEGAPRIPLHRDDLFMIYRGEGLPTPGYDRFGRWVSGYVLPADEIEQLHSVIIHANHEAGRSFLRKYGLVPPGVEHPIQKEILLPFEQNGLVSKGAFNLDFELGKMRQIAQQQGWSIKTNLFDLHAWWYQMLREAEIPCAEIVALTDERFPTFADHGALRLMREVHEDDFRDLCLAAKILLRRTKIPEKLPNDKKAFNQILAYLGRLEIGIGKDDYGIIPHWLYTPVHGNHNEVRKGQKYYLPAQFSFDLVKYFEKASMPPPEEKWLAVFEQNREFYLASGSSSLSESAVRTAVDRTQKKIDQVSPLGTTT